MTISIQPSLHSHSIITLPHNGLCGILGIQPDMTLYAEEIDASDDQITQHIITPDGVIMQSVDETQNALLSVPKDLITPTMPNHHPLNYLGGRMRGLREAERLSDWARPFGIADKMTLISALGLSINAMQLFGTIASVVLSSAPMGGGWSVVCRRIVLALALSKMHHDQNGIPYDYDGHVVQVAHFYHDSWEDTAPTDRVLAGLGGISIHTAHDCVCHDHRLYVSESGLGNRNNAIHQWSIAHPPKTD
ncbi:MAG: hypothetical protein SH821_09285 [Phototrophicales bacterium]|nr:hypothetical protein [Phototrophicales bacterium]